VTACVRRLGPAAVVAAISVNGIAVLTPPAAVAAQLQPDSCKVLTPKEAKRILGKRARAKAQFDGLNVENVRGVGQRAHWLPQTNNFELTVVGEQVDFGELTVLEGQRVYSVFIAPPSTSKARDAMKRVIPD
jgi:hypothetical protein